MFIHHLTDFPEFLAGDHTHLREIFHPLQHPLAAGYSIAQARLLAGAASLPHRLHSSETYYVLQGSGRIYVNGEAGELRPGVIAFVPAHAEQHVENTGSEDLVFLCIVEPYWTKETEVVL